MWLSIGELWEEGATNGVPNRGPRTRHRGQRGGRLIMDAFRRAMIRFEEIAETVQLHHPGADLDVLRRAYVFSAVAHKGQVRASGEPYLSHPLEVASILASWRRPTATQTGSRRQDARMLATSKG